MDKLGFTFYPQDWWSSDSFFDFNATERYVYLECLFIMYRNDGYMKTQKTQFENRIRINVSDEMWDKITAKFIKTDDGFTSLTVNKRLKKAYTSRENGSLGGRPPKLETQKTQDDNLKRKRKRKESEYTDTFGKGKFLITIAKKYTGDKIKKIHDLRIYFTSTNQIESFVECGWVWFDEFMASTPGRVFNDHDHLYNSYRLFCLDYKPPAKETGQYSEAEYNKSLWTKEAWQDFYKGRLQRDENFRKHFGYAKL